MTDELKACPFCGDTPKWGMIDHHYYVKCMNNSCGVQPRNIGKFKKISKDEAFNDWNIRPSTSKGGDL